MEKTYKHRKTGELAYYKDGIIKVGNCSVEIGVEPSSEFWNQILFITDDGVEMFEGGVYFVPQRKGEKYKNYYSFTATERDRYNNVKRFASKQKVLEFIKDFNKEPILTTEDNKDIFEGDDYYYIDKEKLNIIYVESADKNFDSKKEGLLDFKYKENAEEYILMNKPLLSLNDLLSVWGNNKDFDVYKESPMFQNFKNLAKTKM